MSRRASLPGASELFRPTRSVQEPAGQPEAEEKAPARARKPQETGAAEQQTGASGRVRHDHKITVYFSEDELLALEDVNLDLRRTHGIRVDRGRIVRIAVAQALADFAERGGESSLVSELRDQ